MNSILTTEVFDDWLASRQRHAGREAYSGSHRPRRGWQPWRLRTCWRRRLRNANSLRVGLSRVFREARCRQKIFDEEKKAQQNAATEETKQDELLFISSVAALLPDSDAALRRLMTRYCWAEIIGTIGLSRLHLTILQMASYDGKVTLPNMQADRYEAGEKYVARVVRKTTSPHEDVGFYGVDSFAQEPTVEMLRNLVSSGYITTAAPITKNSREFDCEVTPKGMAILALDTRFCRSDTSKTHLWHALSEEVRKIITSVVYRGIQEVQMQKLN